MEYMKKEALCYFSDREATESIWCEKANFIDAKNIFSKA